MPRFMDERVARAVYRKPQPQVQGEPPVPPKTYGPNFWPPKFFNNRKDRLTQRGLIRIGSALVVGCGYGGLIHALRSFGMTDVYGLDPGPWIQDNLEEMQPNPEIRKRIGNDWIGSGTEGETLAALGAPEKFTFVIDEDAAPSHDDDELPHFMSSLEDLLSGGNKKRIIHIVTPLIPENGPGDSSQNYKTIEEWKTFAPQHEWISAWERE